ncbi:trichohyalin-like [Hypanus sabinus]|uniref:trichohyalin-like n=1 Tax=Hypanus sabinus TaxID=79690 RepID=UPI0028C43087|nr:trichohyalin-like [Hypanus sabinus]
MQRSFLYRQYPLPLLLAVVFVLGVLGWTLFPSSLGDDPETVGLQRIRELQREKESLREENGKLRKERDELQRERDELRKERDELRKERDELQRERDELQRERDELRKEGDELQERRQKCETLLEKQNVAQDETVKKLSEKNQGLYSKKEELEGNLQDCQEAQERYSREMQRCKKNNEDILERHRFELNHAGYNCRSKSCDNQEYNIWWLILCFVLGFFLAWCCRSSDGCQ